MIDATIDRRSSAIDVGRQRAVVGDEQVEGALQRLVVRRGQEIEQRGLAPHALAAARLERAQHREARGGEVVVDRELSLDLGSNVSHDRNVEYDHGAD
jgi:hypothetical protein